MDFSGFEEDLQAEIAGNITNVVALEMKAAGLESLVPGFSGADIGPSVKKGVIGFGLQHDTSNYWPIHHTHADTFEKVVPEDLAHNVGIMAIAVYLLAESPIEILPPAPKKRRWRR